MIDSAIYSLISTLLFLYLFAYLPGKFLLQKTKLPDWWDLKIGVGISLLAIVLFFARFILPTNIILTIYLLSTFAILYKQNQLKFKIPKFSFNPFYSLILIGTFFQSLPYIQSLIHKNPLNDIIGSHDQSWHHSVINELLHHYPPQTPGFGGVILKNYHYFYDLIITANVSLFHSSIPYALQVFYPVLISFLFGMAVYRVTSILTRHKPTIASSIMLAYLGSNFAVFLQFFGNPEWHLRDLILDQPIYFLFNHQTVLTIALLAYAVIIISDLIKHPRSKFTAINLSIISAALISFKIYAFVILAATLASVYVFYLIKTLTKSSKTSKQITLSLTLTAVITGSLTIGNLLLNFKFGKSFINVDPFWIVSVFIERVVVPLYPNLASRINIYTLTDNFLGIFVIYAGLTTLFIIASMAFRTFALLRIFTNKRTTFENLLLITSLFSLTFIFIGQQASSSFNIIQFAPYATTYLSVLSVYAVTQQKNKCIIGLFVLSVLFTVPPTVKSIQEYLRYPQQYIDKDKIDILNHLNTVPNGLVISLIERDERSITIDNVRHIYSDYSNNLINTLTYQRSYYSDWLQQEVLQLPHQQRKANLDLLNENICNFKDIDEPVFDQFDHLYLIMYNHQMNNGCITESTPYTADTILTTPTIGIVELTK